MKLPKSLEKVITELSKLPGIGPKSAQRLAMYLLKQDSTNISLLSESIKNIHSEIQYCAICQNMTSQNPCSICLDTQRDQGLVCVVEEAMDALAVDRSGHFKGVFHILGGVLNPIEGIGPEKLNLPGLLKRIEQDQPKIEEVIIATNPTLEGETTAIHIMKLLKAYPITVSRIARGLPMGGDLEYADEITLQRALDGRKTLD